jgi:hypothetical protein
MNDYFSKPKRLSTAVGAARAVGRLDVIIRAIESNFFSGSTHTPAASHARTFF